jgi:hypothetical protein
VQPQLKFEILAGRPDDSSSLARSNLIQIKNERMSSHGCNEIGREGSRCAYLLLTHRMIGRTFFRLNFSEMLLSSDVCLDIRRQSARF